MFTPFISFIIPVGFFKCLIYLCMLFFKFILLPSLIVEVVVGRRRWIVLAWRWTCAYFMTKLHILAHSQSQKPGLDAWPPLQPHLLPPHPPDGVNFKPSVTPFCCHDGAGFGGHRLCLLLIFCLVFAAICFLLKFTYIIVIAVQDILMKTVNFFKPQIERK